MTRCLLIVSLRGIGAETPDDVSVPLRVRHDKYNAKINTVLTPEQAKEWKRMQKDWKDDRIMPKS